MSGVSPSPAEHHLGDRLAALVDGELNHDARERVLAHLATCARCKAEADAQRRVKNLFVETTQPMPSEGLLARLQGLPGGDGGFPGLPGSGGPGFAGAEPEPRFAFPVHAVPATGRHSAVRGRRFAFAAAGAVSLAAFALGGSLPLDPVADPPPVGEGVGPGRPGLLSVSDRDDRDRSHRPAGQPAPLPPVTVIPYLQPAPVRHATPTATLSR